MAKYPSQENIDHDKMVYSLVQRDAIALLLMERKHEGKKEPELARQYEKLWGEHPTIQWHTSL